MSNSRPLTELIGSVMKIDGQERYIKDVQLSRCADGVWRITEIETVSCTSTPKIAIERPSYRAEGGEQ